MWYYDGVFLEKKTKNTAISLTDDCLVDNHQAGTNIEEFLPFSFSNMDYINFIYITYSGVYSTNGIL